MSEEETKKEETKKEDKKEEKKFSVDSLVGMAKNAAIELAKSAGFKTRIVEEDGVANMLTMDVRTDRIGLTIKSGTVEKVEVK